MCAYRPRFERVPKQAASQALWCSVATLNTDGSLTVSPWSERPPSAKRAPYSCTGTCLFAYRLQRPVSGECSSRKPKIGRRGSNSPDRPEPYESPVSPDTTECPAVGSSPKNRSNVPRDPQKSLRMQVSAPAQAPVSGPLCNQQENDPEDCDVVTSSPNRLCAKVNLVDQC